MEEEPDTINRIKFDIERYWLRNLADGKRSFGDDDGN